MIRAFSQRLALSCAVLAALAGSLNAQSSPSGAQFTGNPLAQQGAHMIAGGNLPAPTASTGCGTGATVTGNDVAFHMLAGTSTSQPCTLTFQTPYKNRSTCTVTSESGTQPAYNVNPNGSAIQLTSLADSTRYHFICIGRP